MKFIKTDFSDLILIEPKVFKDGRGFFLESYSTKPFSEHGIDAVFVQDNHSKSSSKGVLRGLHFQEPPFHQSKLIRVVRGSAFDVAVDLRKNSKTYGRWLGFTLSADNCRILFVPRGFAHGFCTLEPDTEVIYKVDNIYSPEHDKGVRWNDPDLGIKWPIDTPILSDKDSKLPYLKEINPPF